MQPDQRHNGPVAAFTETSGEAGGEPVGEAERVHEATLRPRGDQSRSEFLGGRVGRWQGGQTRTWARNFGTRRVIFMPAPGAVSTTRPKSSPNVERIRSSTLPSPT